MLSAVPRNWASWHFSIRDADSQTVAETTLSSWREHGTVKVDGIEYPVRKEGFFKPTFSLIADGMVLARAQKPSAFRRMFTIDFKGRQYILKKKSSWQRGYVVLRDNLEIGSIVPERWYNRRANVDLPKDLPLSVTAFLVWIAVLLWKRDSGAAGA
jgi:hypothetical protein